MLTLSPYIPIYLFTAPTDMRKSFDGLAGLVSDSFNEINYGLYVFHNRRKDRLKILYFDQDGLALWYKRLEQGTFAFPVAKQGQTQISVDSCDLRLILDGVDLNSVKKQKRYRLFSENDTSSDRPTRQPCDQEAV